ncbi:NAD-dependent epimerase/dehydratase family protein [Flagellimonas halotolerans]|uniref:NAD-dependent epimerase/dehydratase family protein n=1 Tax=Flagellimonas halotolerans TaxID=3112164 RepID=A0ABU6INV0_9FLAO|nr:MULTISPECIES: NAD-dependent epimerase/dehydratase family protein [unclassified Allomuricauda]MEC3964857.1 NAD-dependent epimerase/dehydratase family protein [Muricauda sp. SYSU M86414]MEC4264779.1 NAD-dependent epimerase/dehydratase family protein [Muricauda sp. SYSU M84420]
MILVTGGTGLIGSHLLFHLISNGNTIRTNYRTEASKKKVHKVFGYYSDNPSILMEQIDWVQADITDVGGLDSLFDGVEYVYHCAALISFEPKDFKMLERTNVEGTANIVNLSLKYGVKKLCYVSSIAAIGPSIKQKEVTEENEWNEAKANVYGITKYNAELEVWRGSQEGLNIVIVNPGVVIGPGFWKSGSGTFFTYASKGKKYFIPSGTGFVTIKDVIHAMTKLMDSNIRTERFILVNQNMTYKELFQKIAPQLGVAPPTKKVSKFMLECFWRWDWVRSNVFGKRRKLSKSVAKGLYRQKIFSNQKIKSELDFTFEDMDKAITFCCDRFKERV